MPHTIVVLGAGLAATPLIRQVMRTTVLPSKDLRMVVVSHNTHFHWPIAMPRVLVPGQMADDKVMYQLAPTFDEYEPHQFEFVLGAASTLDPISQVVAVSLNSGEPIRSLSYDALVIATGTSSKDGMPWKVLNTTEETRGRLRRLQSDTERAETIVVGGRGLTGVETAGELGYEYSRHGKKDVYLIHNGPLPLSPPILNSVRKQTKVELEKMGVKLVPNTSVTKTTVSGRDTVVELRDATGNTKCLTAQAYISATGVTPNTAFAPPSMLDDHGFVKQTSKLLVEGFSNIFVLGDAGSLEMCKA